MESIDSRVRRIEQRLSSIEKFIAENINPSSGTKKSNDYSIKLGRTSEPVEVEANYHYNYSADFDASTVVKAPLHQVDTSIFNNGSGKLVITDDTLNTAVLGSLIILGLFFVGRVVIDSNWLSQNEQISFATVVGLLFVAMGYVLENTLRTYAKYFPIIGVMLLNLTVFGASNYYSVIPKNLALLAIFGNSVIGMFLFQKFKMQIYQILSVLGAYLVPLYISFQSESGFVNFYFLFVSLFFMVSAVWFRWFQVAVLGAYLSLLVSAISEYVDSDVMNQVMFTLGHFVIFASAYTLTAIRSEVEIKKNYSYGFFPYIILFYIAEYFYVDSWRPSWSPFFTVLTALLLFISYLLIQSFGKPEKHQLTSNLLLSAGSITLAHTIFFVLIPFKFRPIILILAALGIFKFLESLKDQSLKLFSKIFTVFMLSIIGWNYFEVILSQFSLKSYLPYIDAIIYVVVFSYVIFFEKNIVHLKVNKLAVSTMTHLIILSSLFNFLKNSDQNIWMSALAAYMIFAVITMFAINRKNSEID